MAKPHERVFAFIGALLFLATTVAVSVVVIWQARQQRKLDQAQTGQISGQTNPQSNQPEANMLQGTKLDKFTPIDKVTELKIIDTKEGSGKTVEKGATVVAHYTGALAKDGVIFQSSHDGGQPIPFSLDGVIPGWTQGVPGMKVGGIRRLLIPAELAYGAQPPAGSGIPPNADLVFDIELVDIQK